MVRISNIQLIELLERHGRMPYLTIAKRLGVSETAVRKRVKALEKEGVIEGFTILVNPKKLGYEIRAIIGIDAPPERYMEIMELLKVDPNVRRMYISSGDHMFMAECWFKDSEEMATFIKTLNQKEGIVKVCPAIIHEIVKC